MKMMFVAVVRVGARMLMVIERSRVQNSAAAGRLGSIWEWPPFSCVTFWEKKIYTSAGKNYAIQSLSNAGQKSTGKHKFIPTLTKIFGIDL